MTEQPVFDLDARRAARREAKGESFRLKFGGEVYNLPPELPVGIMSMFDDDDIEMMEIIRRLLGDETDRILAAGLTMEDFLEIVEGYQVGLGEAVASKQSSAETGARLRRTSRTTTASISASPATATPPGQVPSVFGGSSTS